MRTATEKIALIGSPLGKKKCHNLKNVRFVNKCPKIKKQKKLKTFPLMTTFYNFAFKIETSIGKMVVKPILKLVMAMMLLCMFDFFILLLKISKNIQCKK